MNQQEQELVWLARKVKKDEDLIERLEDYMDAHHQAWSKDATSAFLDLILKKKDQLDYEIHRLELLAWKVVEDREHKGELPDREALFVFNEVTNKAVNPN